MGQVITEATQLFVTIRAIFMRTFVLFLCLVFPFTRRYSGCFHGCRDRKTAYIGGNKARGDGMLEMGLRTGTDSSQTMAIISTIKLTSGDGTVVH